PVVRAPLGVEAALIVDDNVVPDGDLPRMTEHDVHPERDVPAHASEDQRIELRPQEEAQRTWHPRGQQHDQLVAAERPPSVLADDEIRVALALRALRADLLLDVGDLRVRFPRRTFSGRHSRISRMTYVVLFCDSWYVRDSISPRRPVMTSCTPPRASEIPSSSSGVRSAIGWSAINRT